MRPLLLTTVLCLALGSAATARAQACPPGTSWTRSWTDSYGETSYTIEAPCKVFIGISFPITLTVTDAAHPATDVAFPWSLLDNGVRVAVGGSSWITTDATGHWQTVYTQTYGGSPVDHTLEFRFTDLGSGSGAHGFGASVIGALTVDPYPNAPPAADAGPDRVLLSADVPGAVVAGTASDPDGNALSYRWLEGDAEVQGFAPVATSGSAPLHLGALLPLQLGTHVFTLEVTDGEAVVQDSVTVVIESSPPVLALVPAVTIRVGESVTLAAAVSDADGGTIAYHWLAGSAVLAQGTLAAPAGGALVPIPAFVLYRPRVGTHALTLAVSDGSHAAQATVVVTVTARPARTTYPPPKRPVGHGAVVER